MGIPYQPQSFLIQRLNGRIVAQDNRGRAKWSGTDVGELVTKASEEIAASDVFGHIKLGAGQLFYNSPLKINERVWLQGSGIRGTRLTPEEGYDGNCIEIWKHGPGTYEIFAKISDLMIEGNRPEQTVGSGIVWKGNVSDVTIAHMFIQNFKEYGVHVNNGFKHRILNVWIEYNGSHGVFCDGIDAKLMFCPLLFNYGDGFHAENADGWQLQTCRLANNYLNQIYAYGGIHGKIIGCELGRISQESVTNTYYTIDLRGASRALIMGNTGIGGYPEPTVKVRSHFRLWSSYKTIVMGNSFEYPGAYADHPYILIVDPATTELLIKGNPPYNPCKYVASPFRNTATPYLVSVRYGDSASPVANRTYTCRFVPLTLYVSGGTDVSVTINGQAVPYNTAGSTYTLEPEDTINFGAFTVAPTIIAMGQ